ncbi:MAG TPA: putative hydro-lyase [Kiritimatiellia bacterium]|nr:putative hydro-lyase [Kiritimatiellia bacterium]
MTHPSNWSPAEARARIRRGEWTGPTALLAPGFVQANLVIVPRDAARDFLAFCQRNPAPCPLIEALPPGEWRPAADWASEADLRTDLPRYRIYERGLLAREATDLLRDFHEDLAAFLLGCSFSFDAALARAGLPVRHVESGRNVPMYETCIPCRPAGVFAGPMVVSMRPIPEARVKQAAEITRRIPLAHGAPVHAGDPAQIGIRDLARPEYGDAVDIRAGEVPVFWACGVTPQAVARAARLPLMITHAPGGMFITDRRTADLESRDE